MNSYFHLQLRRMHRIAASDTSKEGLEILTPTKIGLVDDQTEIPTPPGTRGEPR
jgi:hypothetical protein